MFVCPVCLKNTRSSVQYVSRHLLHLFFRQVLFDDEVVDDEVLALGGVLSHVVLQQLLYLVGLVECYLLEAYVWSDEAGELVG